MTVPAQSELFNSSTANGLTTEFPFSFKILSAEDIVVMLDNVIQTSGFTISGLGEDTGGSINFTSAPTNGTVVTRYLDVSLKRDEDYQQFGDWFASVVNGDFDRIILGMQSLKRQIERSLKMPANTAGDKVLSPEPGKFIGWDPSGEPTNLSGNGIADALNVSFSPGGGAPSANLQAWLRAFDQQATDQHFAGNGANINRVNDRLLIGAAADNDGTWPNVAQDWLTQFEIGTGLGAGLIAASVGASLTGGSSNSACGWLSGSQSLNFTAADAACIGNSAFAVNNNTTYATKAWAYYGEAHKLNATCGPVYGQELDVRTLVASISPHPWQQGDVVGQGIGAGCGVSATGQFDASAAYQICANPMKWKVGLNFMHDALAGCDGTSGSGVGKAIALANYQAIQWHNSSGTVMGEIFSTATTTKSSMRFSNSSIAFFGGTDQVLASITQVASAVNYLNLVPNVTTAAPQLSVVGSDTNIDLQLNPKGTGLVRFGTWTSNADTAVNGYVTVKDSAGTTRKLATIA